MDSRKKVTVRMPNKLNSKLYEESQKRGLSKNALILQILWESCKTEKKGE